MLAEFMARIGNVALRRALERPTAIYAQCLMEAGMIGLAGALVGLGLIELGLIACRLVLPPDFAILTRLQGGDVLIALALAVFSALMAGLYPSWRTSRVAYGMQLKGDHSVAWVLPPVLSSLRRNPLAATLIALQIAVTLAVLCNALFIIERRSAQSRSDSGVRDEADVFSVDIRWHGSTADIPSRERTDLAALRSLPQVADAVASIDHPLGGPNLVFGITLHPDRPGSGTQSMVYTVDEHGVDTLGVRLIAGRNFRATEVNDWSYSTGLPASIGGIIVTQALANRLDPHGQVLGRTVTLSPGGTGRRSSA